MDRFAAFAHRLRHLRWPKEACKVFMPPRWVVKATFARSEAFGPVFVNHRPFSLKSSVARNSIV